MKKIFAYITVFALAALAAGCAKEESDILNNEPEQAIAGNENAITVVLNVPESPETKTILGAKNGDSYPVTWSAGDGDYLSLNGTAATASNKDSDTQYSATFKPASGLSVYNFLYRGVSGRDDQVTFPSSQSYVANGFDSASMPMYASSASRSNSVTFNHLGALLKFSLTCNDTDHLPANKGIDAVTLTAEDENMSLSGTFTIGKTSNLLNGTLTPASGGASLTYSFGTHKSLSSTPFVFYIAIPAGTYEGGIKLTIVDNNGGSMDLYVMTESAKKTIAAGTVREFEAVEYVPASEANLIMIYDDASFLKFVNAVAGGRKTVNARVTKNTSPLTLSSETVQAFNSIEGYKGIFDGNNKAIAGLTKPLFDDLQGTVKNLTLNSTISVTDASDYQLGIFAKTIVPSAEVDDDPGLQNCTAEGSVNFTPSSALSNQPSIGGLVGYNKGGVISNCTNNATVEFGDDASVTHTGDRQPAIGGVVARSKSGSVITGCTNDGTVSCAEQFGGNIYMGGVLGFAEATADAISGCTNSGLVTALASCSTTEALHIGGVIGLGKAATIESCTNLTGGTVTTEACTVGSYLCQGGVIGRMSNTSATYSGLTNAGTLNVAGIAADDALIGGIVGRCNQGASLTGMTNTGSINYTAESGEAAFIGGIVARITTPISDCHSTGGTITYTGTNENGPAYVGGIVAYTNASGATVSSCTNAMAIDFGGTFSPSGDNYYAAGGIIGRMAANNAITSCLNTGNVTYSQQISSKGYTFVGGVVGHAQGNIIDSSNGGTVTITGKNSAQNPFYGGVVGSTDSSNELSITGKYSAASATNYGAVVINTTVQSNKYVHVGGVAGRLHTNGSMTATNNGPITISNLTCTIALVGGLAGKTNASSSVINAGSSNLSNGTITITSLTANGYNKYYGSNTSNDGYAVFVGGVVGEAKGAVNATNAGNLAINGLSAGERAGIGGIVGANVGVEVTGTNSGSVVVSSGSSFAHCLFLGGVVGHGKGDITSCTNNASVSNAAQVTSSSKYIQVGGVVGYNNSSSPVTDCHNTAIITNIGDSAGYIYVGGISSESEAAICNCTNTGDVSNSGSSGNKKPICVAGIAGVNSSSISNSSNGTSTQAGGTISNSGISAERLCVAGIYGYSSTNGSVSDSYNKGNVTNSGNSTGGSVFVGGAVGYQNTNTTAVLSYINNSGAVSNTGEVTGDLEIAGVIVDSFGSVDHCTNSGPVRVSADVGKSLYMGGILGYIEPNSSNSVHDCENTATGTISVDGGVKISRQVFCSGVIGGEGKQVEASFYNLINRAEICLDDTIDADETSNKSGSTKWAVYSYISGIGGGHGDSYVTYSNCENYGDIYYKGKHRARVGGILACAWRSPDNSKCEATVEYYCTNASSLKSDVGGVIGYYKAESDGTIDNILYKGYLCTNGSSPRAYTAFLVGRVNNDTVTFTDCKVGGQVKGVGTTYNTAALGCCAVSSHEINFTNLIVETGTKRHTTTINSLSLNYNSSLSVGVLCSGTTAENNSTTLENASTGTMTNCTIGSIDAYL